MVDNIVKEWFDKLWVDVADYVYFGWGMDKDSLNKKWHIIFSYL